jgi:thioredoxin reductase (NADPH)
MEPRPFLIGTKYEGVKREISLLAKFRIPKRANDRTDPPPSNSRPSPRLQTNPNTRKLFAMIPEFDVICIGAGPTGLACAIEVKRAGLRPLVIDKGCLCNSLFHYPTNMQFFTTSERLEIGDIPLTAATSKPTRAEALKYYRRVAEHYNLELSLYETVESITGQDGAFSVATSGADGSHKKHQSRKIILATGYYDRPNLLNIPGENLPHVSHYFTEPHPYWREKVVVIGAKNSAAETALELFRTGAHVTLIHHGPHLGASLKYWVRPDIENRMKAGEITAHFNTEVTRIDPHQVWVMNGSAESAIPATQVFAMTGYHPDFEFLEKMGVRLDPETRKPQCNPETLESNIPGMYVAGVIVGGKYTGEIFIENGRFHGKQIIAAITNKHEPLGPPPVSPPGE